MRRIAVINQKGGVGKTTTVCNLAAAMAARGCKVLTIDLDPQAHLTLHLGVEPGPDRPNAYDVLTSATPIDETALEVRKNLWLVPSCTRLANAETELVSVVGRDVILRDGLEQSQRDDDIVLIDCPPSLGVLTINGLAAANEVNIPLQAHFLGLQGMSELLKTISLVRRRINPELRVTGIILCLFEAGTRLAAEVVEDLTKFLESARGSDVPWSGARLYDACIRRNIKLAECPSYGMSIFDYAPRCNGALDYARLAAEVLGATTAGDQPAAGAETAVPAGRQADAAAPAKATAVPAGGQEAALRIQAESTPRPPDPQTIANIA